MSFDRVEKMLRLPKWNSPALLGAKVQEFARDYKDRTDPSPYALRRAHDHFLFIQVTS